MSENKSKNIVIIALCITLIFMGVGFSLLSQTLTINGTASVSGSWDVHISGITAVKGVYRGAAFDSTADATTLGYFNQSSGPLAAASNILGVKSYDATTATFDVLLNEPGDYVIYDITVANTGTIDAILSTASLYSDSSTDVEAGATAETATDLFTYEVVTSTYASTDTASLTSGAQRLANTSGTEHFYVKVTYNDTALQGIPSNTADETVDTTNFTGTRNLNESRGKLVLSYAQANAS